jgi:hypothetical protein
MKIILVTVLLFVSAIASTQTQKSEVPSKGSISASFRAAAEDVLDCLDGLSLVDVSPDLIYWPQSLKCRPMLRHLGRVAINPDETALAETLNALQSKITACHIAGSGGQPCAEERAVRARAIQEGTLRAPASVGL